MTIEERTQKFAATLDIEWPCFGGSMDRLMAAARKQAEKEAAREARENAAFEENAWLEAVDVHTETGRADALKKLDRAARSCGTWERLNALDTVFRKLYIFPYQVRDPMQMHGWRWASAAMDRFDIEVGRTFRLAYDSLPIRGVSIAPYIGLLEGEKEAARYAEI